MDACSINIINNIIAGRNNYIGRVLSRAFFFDGRGIIIIAWDFLACGRDGIFNC